MKHASLDEMRALLWSGRGSVELEEHLARCPTCALLVSDEARHEERLHEIAHRVPVPRKQAIWLGAALGAAASMLLFVGSVSSTTFVEHRDRSEPVGVPSATFATLDGETATLDGGVPTSSD